MRSQDEKVWDPTRLADPHGQPDKAARVRAMFDGIAPTYERVNRTLSLGRDAYWRNVAVQLAEVRPDDRVLDLACGTGDLTRAFATARPGMVVGCDFAQRMLDFASARSTPFLRWCRADAQRLPLRDASFSIVSCAFGIRNFQDLAQGLAEAHRVLMPGGRIVILEFSMPRRRFVAACYRLYFRRVLPVLGGLISGDRRGAYRYLPESVSTFHDEAGIRDALSAAGFRRIETKRLTAGIVTVFVGRKD